MLDILDIDEATVVSEYRLAKWQAEFEAQFNAPMIEMAALQQQQPMAGEGKPLSKSILMEG